MARILFTTTPIHGHVHANLLLAKTLVERGNEVVWFTGKRFKDSIESVGARHIPMEAFDYDDRKLEEEFPERRNYEGLDKLKFDVKKIFTDPIPAHHEELLRILDIFPADVLLCDATSFSVLPMILARKPKGLKFAVTGFTVLTLSSIDTPPFGPGFPVTPGADERERNKELNDQFQNVIFADVQQYLNKVLADNGFPQTGEYFSDALAKLSDLYLQYTIPSFEYPRSDLPSQVRFVGPMASKPANAEPARLPDWWEELSGDRPVVHVTQGTLDGDFNRLVVPAIQALAEEDALVVVSMGGRPVSSIGVTLPDNVRVSEYLPYDQFLPQVDVMVTNGGYGGVQYALSNGVPLVVAGDTEDKPEVSQRVAWSGAGINLQTGAPTAEQIRRAVKDVLSDGKYRARAQELQAEFARYDGPNDASRLLEQLAAAGEV